MNTDKLSPAQRERLRSQEPKHQNNHQHNHPGGRKWTVAILRTDGTFLRIENVKHVIQKPQTLVLYIGEHGIDRSEQWWPWDRIDHVVIEEGV